MLDAVRMCALFCPVFLPIPAYAAFSEDTALIVEMAFSDSTVVAEGIVIYSGKRNDWFLPLGAVAQALDIAIEVSNSDLAVQGFILDEDRKFYLDFKRLQVFYDAEKRPVDAGDVVHYDDDFFVRRSVLEKWLPIDIVVNPYQSLVVVIPREKLPAQLRREREAESNRAKIGDGYVDPGFPRIKTPHLVFGFPFIDHQQSFRATVADGMRSHAFSHGTQFSGELFEAEAQASLSGDQRKVEGGRLHLARREPEGLGILNLKEIQFYDALIPSLPLISNAMNIRGAVASSFPMQAPTNFDKTDVDGPLPAGWEVFLYKNDVLLERSTGDGKGRYIFRNVRLQYGQNTIRLMFFGPRGERREETRNYNISPTMIQPGASYYRIGLGILDNTSQRLAMQYAKNLFRFLSVSTGVLADRDPNQYFTYASLTGVNELFLFQTTCAANHFGGKACEWAQQFGFGMAAVSSKYTKLFDYRSELYNNDKGAGSKMQNAETSVLLSHPIPVDPPIGMQWEIIKKDFTDRTDQIQLQNNLSLFAGSLGISNRLDYTLNPTPNLTGIWEVSFIPQVVRFAFLTNYDTKRVNSLSLEANYLAAQNFNASARVRYDLNSYRSTFEMAISKLFTSFSIGLNGSYSSLIDYGIGANLAFSLMRDSRGDDLHFSSQGATSTGTASVLVFLDKDRDGVPEKNEPGLSGINVLVNQQPMDLKTDDRGMIFIPRLEAYVPVDLSISQYDIENPNWHPGQKGIRFTPRPGKNAIINLSMLSVGEVDGILSSGEGSTQMIKRVPLELLDGNSDIRYRTKTDSDGLYLFYNIPAGDYFLRIAPGYLRAKKLRAEPKRRKLRIAPQGSFESGNDFVLLQSAGP